VSIPDQNGAKDRLDAGPFQPVFLRHGVFGYQVAEARQGALADGQFGATSIVV
jgi:hypothetical protein